MGLNWTQLIEERNEWHDRNFDDHNVVHCVFGVAEEYGELCHAHLKEAQSVRGSAEDHQLAAMDAIADLTIYLLGVMHHWQCVPAYTALNTFTQADAALLGLGNNVGKICRAALQRVSYPQSVDGVVGSMQSYAAIRAWDYEKLVVDTWGQVKQRDWKRYPLNGVSQ